MFEVRGSILRGINGNMSFTVIICFLFKHSPYFLITPRILAGWCQCSGGTYYPCLKYGHGHLKIEVLCSIPNRLLSFTGYLHYKWESLLYDSLVARISNAATQRKHFY